MPRPHQAHAGAEWAGGALEGGVSVPHVAGGRCVAVGQVAGTRPVLVTSSLGLIFGEGELQLS